MSEQLHDQQRDLWTGQGTGSHEVLHETGGQDADAHDTVAAGGVDATPAPDDGRPVVLVGIDGSEDGLRAARYAARVAGTGARVHLLHVVDDAALAGAWGVVYDPTLLRESGEQATAAAEQAVLDAGLAPGQVHTEVVLGNAADVLSERSRQAALLVLGRRSVSGIERMFVGSTSVAAAAGAHCPAVVISQASNPGPTGGHGLVVVGLDGGRHAASTLHWAAAEAHARGARLDVVHVAEGRARGLFGRDRGGEQAQQAQVQAARAGIDALVDKLRPEFPDLPIEVEVVSGNAVDGLVGRSGHADLLVVGIATNGVTHQVGGTVRGLMAHSQAPLVLIP